MEQLLVVKVSSCLKFPGYSNLARQFKNGDTFDDDTLVCCTANIRYESFSMGIERSVSLGGSFETKYSSSIFNLHFCRQ